MDHRETAQRPNDMEQPYASQPMDTTLSNSEHRAQQHQPIYARVKSVWNDSISESNASTRDEGVSFGTTTFWFCHSSRVQPNVQPAMFSSFEPYQLQESEARNLDMLLDIPFQVTVELGRTKRSVKEILELSSGSIIELDKLAGEPVDILVNNRLIAKGEVVVIDENFGVRVTDIVSKSDRIKKLK